MFQVKKISRKTLHEAGRQFTALLSSFAIVVTSITPAFAQSIIVDPSAPGTGYLQSGNSTPQVNIATPTSGVSVNKYTNFNVDSNGLILNNSTTDGVSQIGAGVTANPNLMVSGPANVIVNEVTGASSSTMTGTVEVFGQSADVVFANPNGITCNGCRFINNTSTTLASGTTSINNGQVNIAITEGNVTIGPDGFVTENIGGILGRHVRIVGPVSTTNTGATNALVISGGSQNVTLDHSTASNRFYTSSAAPIVTPKTSPFAVDISENGTLSAGRIWVYGREVGQGVNVYGDVVTPSSVVYASSGDVFYGSVNTWNMWVYGNDIRQYGDVILRGRFAAGGQKFTLHTGHKIDAQGNVTIAANKFAVIAGEVTGDDITITIGNGRLVNNGFIMAGGNLSVVAGKYITQQRNIATEYDVQMDPALQQYLEAYQQQLLMGGPEADIAAEMLARASVHEVIAEHILQGATMTGTNITLEAGTAYDVDGNPIGVGDIRNTGGAIAATNDILITARDRIINEYLAITSTLGTDDGCPTEDCGFRIDFHPGEILAGNDLTLVAGGNVENRASDMAAGRNVSITSGQDIVNSLMTSNFTVNSTETVNIIGPGLVQVQLDTPVCTGGGDKTAPTCTSYRYEIGDINYDTSQYTFDEQNVLSPGRIAALYGDVDLVAGRDFISIGSEISAGQSVNIVAQDKVVLSSYVDAEEDFIRRNENSVVSVCTGTGDKGDTCTSLLPNDSNTATTTDIIVNTSVTHDGTVLATATSNIIANDINIVAKNDIVLLGARLLAFNNITTQDENGDPTTQSALQLVSTEGSVLIDSTQLPDGVTSFGGGGAEFVELRPDVINQIFGSPDNTAEFTALSTSFTTLLGNTGIVQATTDTLESDAAKAVLNEAISDWRFTFDAANPTDVSASLTSLQTDAARREALADRLLYIIAAKLGTEAESLDANPVENLDETALLERLIANGATDDELHTAALALVDSLTADLLASTQALEAAATSPAALPEITDTYIADRKTDLLGAVITELVNATPTEITPDNTAEFERISVDNAFMRTLTIGLANTLATSMGRDPLFVPDENGEYANVDDLAAIESDPALQRLVLELSLVLSPDNTGGPADASALSTLVLGAASQENNILRMQEKLTEFAPAITRLVADLINQKDLDAKAQSVQNQDLSGLTVDTALTSSLIDKLATSLGSQAKADRQAEIENNTANYLSFLQGNDLLTAVEALRRAPDGVALRDAAHDVGVQSSVSLVDDSYLVALQTQANDAIDSIYETVQTQILTHNQTVSAYNNQVRTDLTALTDLLNLSPADRTAVVQIEITARNQQHQTQLTTIEADYQTQLAANQTQYGPLLTKQVQQWVSVGKDGYYQTVTVPDPYYVNLKNTADAQAATTRQTALNNAQTQLQLDVAEIETRNTDAGLNAEILALKTAFDTQIATYDAQKQVLDDSLNTQIAEAQGIAATLHQQEAVQEELRAQILQAGSVVDGERTLAAALTKEAFPTLSAENPTVTAGLLADSTAAPEDQNKFIKATAWRFATDGGLNQLASTPRSLVYSDADLSVSALNDVYVVGATSVAAKDDLTVNAGRRVGLLGAINTNFRLTDTAYDAFPEIGDTLQLGTLMRDAYVAEADATTSEDATGTSLAFAGDTRNYDLANAVLSAGENLTVSSGGDVLNFGGSLVSGENMFVTAEGDIRNEALRHNFTLTAEHGCVAYACGREGHEYKGAEMLSGSGMILSSGANIINHGSAISSAGSLTAQATGNIENTAITSQYLYHYENRSSFFGLNRKKQLLYRAIINEGSIDALYGDVSLKAGQDILIAGSKVTAGGDVELDATQDVRLNAMSEELRNYFKKRGFGFLSYSSDKVLWNEFSTAFAQVQADNITITAGRDVTGIGALLFAQNDIDIYATEDITFDAHQNNRYEYRSGWSIGISFGGSGILQALFDDGDVLEAYMATNPALSAVYQLGTAKGKWGTINGLLNLGYHLPSLGSAINKGAGGMPDIKASLVNQLNPFSWMKDNALLNPSSLAAGEKLNAKNMLSGITFRLGAYKSSREWTESHISQLIAGNDLWLDAGKDVSLVGGTVASANRDTSLYAGENILLAALSDTNRSSSSGWGLSLGFGESGVTFGVDYNRSSGSGEMFTNASLTAGENLYTNSGLDTVLMGANIAAHDIYIDVGQDLIVQSRQNTSASNSFGFNFSITVAPGAITGVSGGVNFSDANRQYTDTPTTIVAQDRLSIYTARNTFLLGAGIYSTVGNLKLDTSGLVFDNYDDTETSSSGGISVTLTFDKGDLDRKKSDASGSMAYHDIQAITFATIGAGDITVRDAREGFDLDELNRDQDNMQRIISETEFSIEIPGINLKRWNEQVKDTINLIEAVTTKVPDYVRNQGEQAIDLYRDAILSGLSGADLTAYMGSAAFRKQLQVRKNYIQAIAQEEPAAKIQSLYNSILFGETLYFDKNGQARVKVECNVAGVCSVLAAELGKDVSEIDSQALIDLVYEELGRIDGIPEAELLVMAYACSIELARFGDYSALVSFTENPENQEAFYAAARADGFVDVDKLYISIEIFRAIETGNTTVLENLKATLAPEYLEALALYQGTEISLDERLILDQILGEQQFIVEFLDEAITRINAGAVTDGFVTRNSVLVLSQSHETAGYGLVAAGLTIPGSALIGRLAKLGWGRVKILPRFLTPNRVLNTSDFPSISSKLSQKQNRHLEKGIDQRTGRPVTGSVMKTLADAQQVLDAYHSGQATIIGRTTNGFPVVRYDAVTGLNNNIGAGYINQPTNVFIIKGTSKPSIVPTNPNWTQ